MKKIAYLCVSCDTDPDINPPYAEVPSKESCDDIWQGIVFGIPALRQRLKETCFASKYGQLPVTWLLRSDRQIYELYKDASFCFKRFEKVWKSEQGHGSDIGWHPHLYRWHRQACRWAEHLGKDDDLEILAECLNSLRLYTDVYAVRTGWDYHSNKLIGLFDREGLLVDASAIPGTVQSGTWFFDWRGAPRTPYFPSKIDYRQPAESREHALSIIEMPVLVRSLSLPWHLLRYSLRKLRAIRSHCDDFTDWGSSRYQGLRITSKGGAFYKAIQQTLAASSEEETVFLNTYFHTNELLSSRSVDNLVRNLEKISCLAERGGRTLVPVTLSVAAPFAKSAVNMF